MGVNIQYSRDTGQGPVAIITSKPNRLYAQRIESNGTGSVCTVLPVLMGWLIYVDQRLNIELDL